MRRIFAQSRKELTQIIRDWRTLALALVLPLVLLQTGTQRLALSLDCSTTAIGVEPKKRIRIDPIPGLLED